MHVDEEDLRQDLRQDRILAKARRRFVFELDRIIDDDFRGRYLERELVARSPEAIIAEICAGAPLSDCVSLGEGPFFFPGGIIAPGPAQSLTPPNSSPEAPGAAP